MEAWIDMKIKRPRSEKCKEDQDGDGHQDGTGNERNGVAEAPTGTENRRTKEGTSTDQARENTPIRSKQNRTEPDTEGFARLTPRNTTGNLDERMLTINWEVFIDQ